MAQPTPYVRQFDFVDFQTDNPSGPLPASSVEQELDAVKTTLDETLANIELLQRDDGGLANNSVGVEQLDAGARAFIAAEGVIRGAWLTATAYNLRDVVTKDGATYICALAHTSGTFSTDFAAVRWVTLAAFVDPMVSLTPGSVGSTEIADNAVVLAKMADGSVGTAEIIDANVTAAKLAANSITTVKILDANVTDAKLASNAVTTTKILDASVTTAKLADASVAWGKLGAALFNQTAVSPSTGDKVVISDASDAGNSKVVLVSELLALTPPGASGEVNTASNVGTGADVWKDKVGFDLRFRKVRAGSVTLTRSGAIGTGLIASISSGTITVVQNANDIQIDLTIVFTNQQPGGGT